MNEQATNGTGASDIEAVLLSPWRAVAEITSEQLEARIKSTIVVENQAAAIRAEAVAEMGRRKGTEPTETVLRKSGLLSGGRAKSEMETAQQLEQLPNTRKGLEEGEISRDNARIIAGASRRGTIDEGSWRRSPARRLLTSSRGRSAVTSGTVPPTTGRLG